jgi:predicted short-subunit dehydrogenase-like oxidoreductase (DUF2520 family)
VGENGAVSQHHLPPLELPHQHDPEHPHAHPHARDEDRYDAPPRLGIVGAGHVGLTLGMAFSRAGWPVAAVASRDEGRRARFQAAVPGVRAYDLPQPLVDDVEVIFLTVPDDAVGPLAASLRLYGGQALVHTSGLLPASVLQPAMAAGTLKGSFHPLIAFADPERALAALSGATVALEGDEPIVALLAELAEAIGAQPVRLPPEGKVAYHAAAVLAAGGAVGLLDVLVEVARGAGLDERQALAVYLPLMRQALDEAEALGPRAALTGPIVRGDAGTLRAHLAALSSLAPEARELYRAVARHELALARARGALDPARAAELDRLLAPGA